MTSDTLNIKFGRHYRPGDVLFREGEIGKEMFVIQEGLVQVTRRVGGEDRPIATLGRGEFLGEMSILNDKPRTATATAVEESDCLVIDGRTLEAMVSRNTEIALRLIKKLAARLDAADELIQILMHPDPKARVMLALKRHAESEGVTTNDGIRVHVTAEDLAREVGAEPLDVHEVMARLERLQIATPASGGNILIADVRRLLEFLEFLDMPRMFEAT